VHCPNAGCIAQSLLLSCATHQSALSTRNLASVVTLGLSFGVFLLWIMFVSSTGYDSDKWRKLIFRKRGSLEGDRRLSDARKNPAAVIVVPVHRHSVMCVFVIP
jgi:hypothetical protein